MRVIIQPGHMLQQARYLNPDFPPEVAYWYAELAPGFGIDVRFAFAQMAKETNWWRFTGEAKPEWNNPAGLGVDGSPGVGIRFDSVLSGVLGHLSHLLCYYGDHANLCRYNPPRPVGRHFGAGWEIGKGDRMVVTDATGHLHLPNDATELNGRWAQPGVGYGESIERIVNQWL